jgi:Carboxypeptidase regulatory-like domain
MLVMTRFALSLVLLFSLASCNNIDSLTGPERASLSGTFTYSNGGHTLAGATIGLLNASGDIIGSGQTNNYGRYSISHLRTGHYTMVVQTSYYVQVLRAEIDVHEGANTFDAAV